ncbi:MAG: phosphatidate cytidylyltransferase [Campylobacteraceae bacterium]|jgi:phosphatidate cytidylyltransferase|nr:phosphatidate cytidylyltransferase [Campylobacteraceae bacterium]
MNETLALFLGVGAVLLFASAVGLVLKIRQKTPNPIIENLNARIYSWWIMAALIGATFWLGNSAVITLFLLISALALREFITITPTNQNDYYALLFAFYVALPVQYLFVYVEWYGMFSIFIPVYVFLLLPILSSFKADVKNFLERCAKTQWGVMISIYCISCVPALLILEVEGYEGKNLLLIAFLIIVVQISDVLQYVFGKLFGKHKIAPTLSPSKTTEGFVLGVLSASIVGGLLFWITPFNFWQALLISLILTLLGFFGGLVMSAIKRDGGIKDWGYMIEGHGGILDRLDSVCFAAPIFFHIVRFWWT